MTVTLLVLLAAYLMGSVAFAILMAKLYGLPDPRSHGSGNPGATNMLRTGKKSAAALTLIGDALKGYLAVLLAQGVAQAYGLPVYVPYLAALAAFLGHLFPVFHGFKGGKGVATALGVLLALDPRLGGLAVLTWLAVFALTRVSSLSALVAATRAEREDTRVTANTTIHVSTARPPSRGSRARSTPRAVATPLPPLKPWKTGNRWPRKAARAAR